MVRWADGIRIRAIGEEARIERGAELLVIFPDGAIPLRILSELLVTPRPLGLLRGALVNTAWAESEDIMLRDLIERKLLVECPLAEELSMLHMSTIRGGSGIPPIFEMGRMFRESSLTGAVDLPCRQPLEMHLVDTLCNRRSQREFSSSQLPLSSLATLLGWSSGHRGLDQEPPLPLAEQSPVGPRTYPSGGALYPVELLVWPLFVEGLDPSRCYYYQILANRLLPLTPNDGRNVRDCLNAENDVKDASALLLLFVDFTRTSLGKYGPKAYRLALLEAGHLGQNLLLTATAQGLASIPLCGFQDDAISTISGLQFPYQAVVYAIAIGFTSVPRVIS